MRTLVKSRLGSWAQRFDLTPAHPPPLRWTTPPVLLVVAHLHSHASQSLQIKGASPAVRRSSRARARIDDVMALDWMISNAAASTVSPNPGSAMRFRFYKLKKESLGEVEKARVLEVMGGIEELSSVGESFCDDRAKGYTIASIAVFPNGNPPAADLDLNYSGDLLLLKEEVMKDSIQSVVVVDYVIPSP